MCKLMRATCQKENSFLRFIGGIVLLSLFSCNGQKTLFIENPKNAGVENPYNYDNKIFLSNKEYIFDYYIIKNLDTLKYKIINDSTFSYVSWKDNSENVVEFLSIKTLKNKGPIFNDHKDYNQTEIILSHLNKHQKSLKQELTGVIENRENLWLHPFRTNAFQILQFSPFLYIKKDAKKEYRWNLNIGRHWPELKSINWNGILKLKCKYKNEYQTILKTAFGNLNVTKTFSSCKSKIGRSTLTTFYNEKLGFVRLNYNLSNNEKIEMNLIKINE